MSILLEQIGIYGTLQERKKTMPIYTYKSKDGKHEQDLMSSKFLSPEEDVEPREVEIDGEKVTLYRVKELPKKIAEMRMNWGDWNPNKRF